MLPRKLNRKILVLFLILAMNLASFTVYAAGTVSVTSVSLNKTTVNLMAGETDTLTAIVSPSNATNQSVTWLSSNTSVATVDSNGIVTGVNAGSAVIVASTVDGSKKATCTVTVTGTTAVHPTSVSLNKADDAIIAGGTDALTATVLPSNATNKNVTWTSSNTNVATVDSNGVVTGVNAGSAVIVASTVDGSKKATCTVTVTGTTTVHPTSVSLNKADDAITAGGTDALTATVSPSNATNKNVTWTSSNTNVATVDSNGVVTGVNAGSAIIIATTVDGSKKATCTVTVTGTTTVHPTSVSLNKADDAITAGGTDALTATVLPSNATNKNVTWTSSNTNVATVDSNGVVTGVNAGSAVIVASTVDGSKKATCTVTVTGTTTVHPTSVSLNKADDAITAGGTDALTATVSPSNATNKNVTWTSSNTNVATVDSNGVVTGVNAGSAIIIATTVDGSKKATCTVTVTGTTTVHPTSVSLNKADDAITAGGTDALTATVLPSNATNKNVTWTSSNTNVATVDSNGVVTGVNAGSAVIVASTVDGSKKATCTVTVTGTTTVHPTSVSLNKADDAITAGGTDALTATVSPSNATNKNVTWTSSNTNVATVDSNGVVTGVNAGSAIIIATTVDGSKKATCTVTVTGTTTVHPTSVSLNKADDAITAGGTDALTATVSPSNATNKNVTWTSSNTNVATVDSNGVVTAVNAGSAIIVVATVDGSKKATCTVTVTGTTTVHPTSVSLNKAEDAITAGETDTLTATVLPGDATNQNVTWTSSNTNVATVDSNGVVTAVNAGSAIIVVATVDGSKKATCTVTVTGTTTVHPTSVSLNKAEDAITAGETDTLTATVLPGDATNQNVTWTSSNTNVATVDSNGVVTAVNAGSAIIVVATVDGSKKATCTVTVTGTTTVHPTSVSINKADDTIVAGETDTLTATVSPSNATNQNVTWLSSNTNVATVDSNGVVTGVNAGSAIIIATTVDGSKKATCTITVTGNGNASVQQGIKGIVKDAVTNAGISGVSISVLNSSGATIATASSSSSGEFNITIPADSGYSVTLNKDGYIPSTYKNVEVTANQITYLETILQIDNQHAGLGTVTGTITNALNGQAVSGVTLNLRKGINVKSGDIISTTITGDQGTYSITDLEAGNYTAEISKDGFTTSYFTVISIGGTTKTNQNATITPNVPTGQTRIVLTWGASPSDLDSHLTGPTVDGSRFHIYYGDKVYSSGATTYVNLDVDDTTSYGPETTTINVQSEGRYRYSVYDYTNGSSTSSSALSNSGATVKVYSGSESIATFYVPANKIGKTWTVFELDGTTLTPINTITNNYPE
ncbi:beta strand repeat-containing protein [Clostridium beijerinckii]|uniref:beta strand repeat-containing protein n=1 Tax=Clostridium beijerinckii TaxID=1520 RepID=UPI0006BB5123|nr:Ig-like domain-containing protein [Clostridium beijerinckii]AQS18342.1 hypothetical protein X276_27350 [Clostridium beijerinckii NRRL B-598]